MLADAAKSCNVLEEATAEGVGLRRGGGRAMSSRQLKTTTEIDVGASRDGVKK
jgi:hypothetical protein